ncbi:hypothetical protein SAMN05216201_10340 [Pseudomonas linyingensis]|uniref:DUF1449 family protein n=1 Tax=Pseudomonas linyingensis TaxID=915471 RepID=A0A1H6UC80_9PSED|nr:OB-fold-containig protein [Pseudomonas linyingensis]SEI89921.1 hypothetical protein SAMN05216201_10340 [Pseudomonas linyingensis]
MELFLQSALAFPTALFSFLLSVAILYWLVAALGILEVDVLDGDFAPDGEGPELEGLAGLLLKLGLGGVPVTLVLTLLVFFAWFASYFIELLLLRHLPLGWLRYPLGVAVAALALLPAVPLTAALCRPLRRLFRKVEAPSARSLLGQVARVRSGTVTAQFGEADLDDQGAGLILRVRADAAQGFKRGDRVVLLQYLEGEHAYRVVSEDEFKGL